MHNLCRDRCCEVDCECEKVTGIPDVFPIFRGGKTPELKERNSDIWELRKCGISYTRIAKDYMLTKERVRQICMREERKHQKSE